MLIDTPAAIAEGFRRGAQGRAAVRRSFGGMLPAALMGLAFFRGTPMFAQAQATGTRSGRIPVTRILRESVSENYSG